MIEYPKIETMFHRDPVTFKVDQERYRCPTWDAISVWDVTEKIDGMNIRVDWKPDGSVKIRGRTDNAQLPTDLVDTVQKTFSPEKRNAFPQLFSPEGRTAFPLIDSVVLYGEGYGAGIQRGGAYRPDKSFILFDVLVDDKLWLSPAEVRHVARELNIDAVPCLGEMPLTDAVDFVAQGFYSKIGTAKAEGIVARPIQTLFDTYHQRVIVKLKTRDFKGGK